MRSLPIALIAAVFAAVGAAHAESKHVTRDEAQTMVKKAVSHYTAAGRDKAFADFNQKGGPFTDRDLYVFVVDFTGLTLAHGGNAKLVGRDMIALKDVDGKAFVAEFISGPKAGKPSWTDYKWPNPVTKEIEAKTTYCEPVDNLAVCAGIYK